MQKNKRTILLSDNDIINTLHGLKILAATQVQNPIQLKEIKNLIDKFKKELEE